jgi:LysM repeat protein
MNEDVRKPLTFLAAVAIALVLGLGWDRVKAWQVFQSDFNEGKDRGTVTAKAASQELVYKVQAGDAWWKIARDHSVSTRALLDANGANIGTELVPGQNIHLPASTAPTASTPPVL